MTTKTLLAPVEIPLSLDTPLYDMRATLDGREFIIHLDYCEREFRWYLSISTVDGVDLATGIKVVANWPLLRRYANEDLPPGELVALDGSPEGGEPPEFEDMGRRVRLVYYPIQA